MSNLRTHVLATFAAAAVGVALALGMGTVATGAAVTACAVAT
jgi:hypothetical protein